MNQLFKPHHMPDFSLRLAAKPVENSEHWETPVDKVERNQPRKATRSPKQS